MVVCRSKTDRVKHGCNEIDAVAKAPPVQVAAIWAFSCSPSNSPRLAAQKCPSKRLRSSREAVTYKGATGEIKAFEKGGRVELSLKGLSTAAAQELTDALRMLLA